MLFAGSAWLALSTVAFAGPDAVPRVGVPASVLWLPLFTLIGVCVPAFRRRPELAAPALLATVSWWPVPLPAAVMLWSGGLAWIPVIATLVAGIRESIGSSAGGGQPHSEGEGPSTFSPRLHRRSAFSAALLTGVLAGLAATALHARLPQGDEWAYLMITQSLRKDGDLRIENNHQQRDYRTFYSGTLPPDFLQRGKDGEIYSIHAPGVSTLVLPLFSAFDYLGAQATMILVASVTGGLIWLIGWLATGDRGSAWFAWAAIVGSITFLVQSVTVFPDGPGALVVAATVAAVLWYWRTGQASPASLMAISSLLACLPWLHTRFVVLAVGLAVVIASEYVRVCVTASGAGGRDLQGGGRTLTRGLLAFSVVPLCSAVCWFAYFYMIYGTFNPAAPYGPHPETRLAYVPGGIAGLLFDQQFGLFTFAPVLIAGLVGWTLRPLAGERSLRGTIFVLGSYLVGIGAYWMWWAGVPATPARFITAGLPLLAAPAAVSWRRAGSSGRLLWTILLTFSCVTSAFVLLVDEGRLAWSVRGTAAGWIDWLHPLANAVRVWPSFFWRLTPGVVETEVVFGRHVLSWVLIGAGVILLVRHLDRAHTASPSLVLWTVLTVPFAGAALSWPLIGAASRPADGGQLALWRVLAREVPAGEMRSAVGGWEIRPASIWRRWRGPSPGLALQRRDEDDSRTAVWSVDAVPPGEFELHVTTKGDAAGDMAVSLGGESLVTAHLPLPGDRLAIRLPAGATRLDVALAGIADPSAARVTLLPRGLLSVRNGRYASAFRRYGPVTVGFLDDHAFAEPDGFWVKAQQTAHVLVSAPSGAGPVRLEVRNGTAANALVVTINGTSSVISLAPSAAHVLTVPLDATGRAEVAIKAPSGFRPSEGGTSADDRYLGVRVRVTE